MRTQTGAESTLLASPNYGIHQRVKVANGSDLVDLSGYVQRITTDEDIDQPTAQATVEFRRDASATLSLAPLRTDSTLNRQDDGTTYSPQKTPMRVPAHGLTQLGTRSIESLLIGGNASPSTESSVCI